MILQKELTFASPPASLFSSSSFSFMKNIRQFSGVLRVDAAFPRSDFVHTTKVKFRYLVSVIAPARVDASNCKNNFHVIERIVLSAAFFFFFFCSSLYLYNGGFEGETFCINLRFNGIALYQWYNTANLRTWRQRIVNLNRYINIRHYILNFKRFSSFYDVCTNSLSILVQSGCTTDNPTFSILHSKSSGRDEVANCTKITIQSSSNEH